MAQYLPERLVSTKYLQHFPKPLLDDLVAGRWLPVVGAGFSLNAISPAGTKMPLWAELGASFADDLGDYAASGTIDAISAYEHEFGRSKLIERLSELLHVSDTTPGLAHQEFCEIPFDIVCTTNFDYLLERQYELGRTCTPIIDEDQLSINVRESGVALVKLHGDMRHPSRLVATEADYDKFLDRYPMLATYLANLLITRTAVLIGYSLDDPDFRQLWEIVGNRLGRSRRIAFAIAVGAKPTEIARFARRGVKLINLPAGKTKYGEVLAEAFRELRTFWRTKVIPSSQLKEEQSLRELSLPADAQTRLCFFAIPLSLLSFYRDKVFPIVEQSGFVPVTADDVVTPGDTVLPKIDALVARSLLMVVDVSTDFTLLELKLGRRRVVPSRLLVLVSPDRALPALAAGASLIRRPDLSGDIEIFLGQLQQWFDAAAAELKPTVVAEPARLLASGEYRAAVVSAISLLESVLRRHTKLVSDSLHSRPVGLMDLVNRANAVGLLGNFPIGRIREALDIRNQIVHRNKSVTKAKAGEIVKTVLEIVATLN